MGPVNEKYSKTPLVEVVAELRFEAPLAEECLKKFVNNLKDKFPHQEIRDIVTVGFQIAKTEVTTDSSSNKRFMLFSSNRKLLIQIDSNLLAINRLEPYEGWESFTPTINDAVGTLSAINQTIAINSMVLRYINHIEIESNSDSIQDYFHFILQMKKFKLIAAKSL